MEDGVRGGSGPGEVVVRVEDVIRGEDVVRGRMGSGWMNLSGGTRGSEGGWCQGEEKYNTERFKVLASKTVWQRPRLGATFDTLTHTNIHP